MLEFDAGILTRCVGLLRDEIIFILLASPLARNGGGYSHRLFSPCHGTGTSRWIEEAWADVLTHAFAEKHIGPLDEAHIDSLVEFLVATFPVEPKKN